MNEAREAYLDYIGEQADILKAGGRVGWQTLTELRSEFSKRNSGKKSEEICEMHENCSDGQERNLVPSKQLLRILKNDFAGWKSLTRALKSKFSKSLLDLL